jgi:hypothetical protein
MCSVLDEDGEMERKRRSKPGTDEDLSRTTDANNGKKRRFPVDLLTVEQGATNHL